MKRLITGVVAAALLATGTASPASALGSSTALSSAGSSALSSGDPISVTLRVISIFSILAKLPQFVQDVQTVTGLHGVVLPPIPSLSDMITPGAPNHLAEPHPVPPTKG